MNKLVIAIPTYNYASALKRTLSSILVPCINLSVPIFVIDNCSPDSTIDVLEKFKEEHPKLDISWHRNKVNIGIDGSVLYIWEKFQGTDTMVWFLSDDDILYEKELKQYMKFLISTDALAVISKFDGIDLRSVSIIPDRKRSKNNIGDIYYIGFIPSLAIKVPNQELHSDVYKLKGLSYIHIAIFNDIMNSLSEVELYEIPIGFQMPNFSWRFSFFDTFLLGWKKAIFCRNRLFSFTELNSNAITTCKVWLRALVLSRLNLYKIDYNLTIWDSIKLMRLYGWRTFGLIPYFILLLAPNSLFKLTLKIVLGKKVLEQIERNLKGSEEIAVQIREKYEIGKIERNRLEQIINEFSFEQKVKL